MSSGNQVNNIVSETGARVNAAAEWRSRLAAITGGLLLFLSISGLVIYLVPFNEFSQFNVLVHTVVGLAMLVPVTWYVIRHWRVRRRGKLSHYQLLGYISAAMILACVVSGFVVTWQGLVGPRMSYTWDLVHLITGLAMGAFIIVHLATVIVRKVNNPDALRLLRSARRRFYVRSVAAGGGLVVLCAVWAGMYTDPQLKQGFSDDYNWRFGEDRPFWPSLARVDQSQWHNQVQDRVLQVVGDQSRLAYLAAFKKIEREPIGLFAQIRQCAGNLDLTVEQRKEIDAILSGAVDDVKRRGAIDPRALAGSAGCGTSGCHTEIYKEWLPSAHRYSSMDDMFQRVQELMAKETSPEHTRYCAGCHDPIALFSGAKNSGNITLSVEGSDEGLSCLVCHSIVQTDVQGNGDYTIDPPPRYVYELKEGSVAKFLSDFLIRTYPKHHISSYSRSLYKTPEFCAACHKQYIDESVNTDIGKVQGQNQYDSWKNSRWHSAGDPTKTVSCRECHMPLVASNDPARGDVTDYNRSAGDRKHRSHRNLASNQYIPLLHQLEGAEVHTAMTEQWLRGEIEIPEIAHKWTSGPVVRMYIAAPKQVKAGEEVSLQVVLTNNKTGHDFPTGPLDMIESWVELIVTDSDGTVLHHTGGLDESGSIVESQVLLKADVFDRRGEPIDRHNLWDLVGASYKRTLYPGATDTVEVRFRCPSMARGRVSDSTERTLLAERTENYSIKAPRDGVLDSITATAILWYRKANPEFLDTVYGIDAGVRAPIVELTRTSTTIKVLADIKGATE